MRAEKISSRAENRFVQADILDRGPDNRQATGLGREHIDLISPLSHIAEETFNGVGRLNMPVHRLRKSIKGQQVLFILSQAANCFGIALSILGFEGSQLGQRLRLAGLLPDAHQFGLHLAALSSGDGGKHITLFMYQTALTRGVAANNSPTAPNKPSWPSVTIRSIWMAPLPYPL